MKDFFTRDGTTYILGDRISVNSILCNEGTLVKICDNDFIHLEKDNGVKVGICVSNIKEIRKIERTQNE